MVMVPVIMPKRVAAMPATVESSAMIERCDTGLVRLKSVPRVVVPFPFCQAEMDYFFSKAAFQPVSDPDYWRSALNEVEFFT